MFLFSAVTVFLVLADLTARLAMRAQNKSLLKVEVR
jgi:hypothetical protein